MYNFYLNKRVPLPISSRIRKILLIMKLTTFILITVILHVSATSMAQKVTLKTKEASLTEVFDQIRTQTGYDFALTTDALKDAKTVTINLKNVELKDALTEILKGQQLDFSLDNKIVVIKPKEVTVLEKIKDIFVNIDVRGRVVGDDGQPLAGATVMVKNNYQLAVMTDPNGFFTLPNIDPNATIVITFIGYEKTEIAAKAQLGTIRLKVTESKLDEVQVIAYGRTSERLSTGNINMVTSKTIANQPVSNPLLGLQGQLPGLYIKQANGIPGSAVTVQVVGQNSIGQGNDPLYIVDGVPYPSIPIPTVNGIQGIGATGNIGASTGPSPLTFINPDDIESITLLKDADATSIYGSRAANGVLLIMTKKGKTGATRVSFNLQNGWGKNTRRMGLLNTQQYLQMRHQAFANDGLTVPTISLTPGDVNYDVNGLWGQNRYTDWQKELLGGTAGYTDLNTSVSGGTTNTQFLVGTTYHREGTVFPGDFSDQKGSLHFNLQHNSENRKFTLSLTGNYLADRNQLPTTDVTTTALFLAPNAPALYNPDGSLNWAPNPYAAGNSSWTNPLANYQVASLIKTNNLIASLTTGYHILPNFLIKADASYNHIEDSESLEQPITLQAPENRTSNSSRAAIFEHNDVDTWNLEPQLVYNRLIGNGKLEGVGGMQITQTNSFGQYILASGFASDLLLGDAGSAASWSAKTISPATYKYVAGFARLNYNWKDTYILNISTRRDGSSRFGPENRFHNFWSVAGAWIFSENFKVKNIIPLLSFGKLSLSYGTTGNDQIPNYQYLNTYSTPSAVSTAYQGTAGLQPNGLTNPYLQWEETHKLNIKLDLGFFQDRILFSADYYRNRSSNELLAYSLSIVAGFNTIQQNFPATVQNSGWELTLNTVNIKTKDFTWRTNLNLTIPRNKLIAFPDLLTSSYATRLVVGLPVNIVHSYQYLGVDPLTGTYRFASAQGEPVPTPVTADYLAGTIEKLDPNYYGGFQNTLTWKRWQLGFLFQFTKTYQVLNSYGVLGIPSGSGHFSGSLGNQPLYTLNNVWQQPGDRAIFQRYSSSTTINNNYSSSSSLVFTDGSYARLKNVSLSYQLPEVWVKKAGMQSCRLYTDAQNLLTITNFTGLDPEMYSSPNLPPLRVISLGIQVGF